MGLFTASVHPAYKRLSYIRKFIQLFSQFGEDKWSRIQGVRDSRVIEGRASGACPALNPGFNGVKTFYDSMNLYFLSIQPESLNP
jgi:hypothetical protein